MHIANILFLALAYREEYNNLESFIQSKGIKTSNEMNDDVCTIYA